MVSERAEIQVRRMIKPGSVFYIIKEDDKDLFHHFFVILNYSPKTEKIMVLVRGNTPSGNYYGRIYRDNISDEDRRNTIIEVSHQESPLFKKSITSFNCNYLRLPSLGKIIEKYENNEIKHLGYVNKNTLNKLRVGVLQSRIVLKKYKYILLRGAKK